MVEALYAASSYNEIPIPQLSLSKASEVCGEPKLNCEISAFFIEEHKESKRKLQLGFLSISTDSSLSSFHRCFHTFKNGAVSSSSSFLEGIVFVEVKECFCAGLLLCRSLVRAHSHFSRSCLNIVSPTRHSLLKLFDLGIG